MHHLPNSANLPARLVEAWPRAAWRDVHALVAASGGADSMALVRAAVEARRADGGAGRLIVGHVNHGLRGAESDADEAWLRQQCEQMGVPFVSRRCDTAALANDAGDGVEAAARAARYQALTEMAEAAGARFVATAHTRDDQVETVLFRLLRGTGLRGMAGVPARRPLSPAVTLVRPLLGCSRVDVCAYLQAIGQQYRDDATNANLQFSRNRIRHELLPYLREHFNVGIDDALAGTADIAAEAQTVLDALAAQLLAECRTIDARGNSIALRVEPLADQPELLVREVVRQAWREASLAEQAMTSRHWCQLSQLAQSSGVAPLALPGGVRASREGDELLIQGPR